MNDKEMAEKIAATEHLLRQMKANQLDNYVELLLLNLQIATRKAYPELTDVKPTARKIVAYLREHMVAE